jgi:hypothetical protein
LGRGRSGLAAGLVALALAAPAAAKVTGVPSAQTVVTLDPDGVLAVLEHVSVQADEPTPAAWQVTMQRGELFAQPSLVVDERRYRPGDAKQPGTFHISRAVTGIRFDWLQPGGTHSVRIAYRLALVGTAYTDVVDLRVPVWERDWPVPVSNLTAVLKLPRRPKGQVILWIEPQSRQAAITRSTDQIRLQARDVPARSPLILHTVLPRNVLTSFDGVSVETKPGLAAILDARRNDNRDRWPWVLAAGTVLGLSAVVVVFRTARSRQLRRR